MLPGTTVERAIELALEHLLASDIDLSDRFLVSARWCQLGPGREHGSLLEWMTEEQFVARQDHPRLRGGGHLCVEVMDRLTVRHSFAR